MGRKAYKPPMAGRKHTINPNGTGEKTEWDELAITGKIKNLSPVLFGYDFLRVLHLNDNQLTGISKEITRLVHLEYLDISKNKLVSVPAELGDMTELKELLLNNNRLNHIPYELGKLFQLKTFQLDGNPILDGHNDSNELKLAYHSGVGTVLTYMLDRLRVTGSHPPQRPWLPRGHPTRDYPNALFTVMSYNVLCDFYCSRQTYGYTPSWALHWDYRRRGILEEIKHYSADVICLQEVEKEQYDAFFRVEFAKDGYEGIYESKSRCKTMTEDTSKRVDGCAIFWRTSKFNLKRKTCIEYSRLAIENRQNCVNMINRVQNKDNIALCALLETKEAAWDSNALPKPEHMNRELLVSNTHITWDPDYADVKVMQTMMLVDGIKTFLEEQNTERKSKADVPMILCGDFNSMPDSAVWDFLTKGKLDRRHTEFKDKYTRDVLNKFSETQSTDGDGYVSHSFDLSSAYKKEDMPFTNYTYDFKGILDYIFHTEQFNTLGVLGPLEPAWFKDNKVVGCPHPHIHSDHFSLLVEFELPDKENHK